MESAYQQCLCREQGDAGIVVARQIAIRNAYNGVAVDDGFKADIVVANECIFKIEAVTTILPIREVQRRPCLRMSGVHVDLLRNFEVPRVVDGLRRYVV